MGQPRSLFVYFRDFQELGNRIIGRMRRQYQEIRTFKKWQICRIGKIRKMTKTTSIVFVDTGLEGLSENNHHRGKYYFD